jgi:GDP-L-galactose phosphorylase
VVLINVSPIDYGHVLLCPRVLDCIPQVLDPATCLTALHFALEVNNPYLRVGFNSLGAFATINHLHFQAYYLNAPLPCERAPTSPLGLAVLPKRRRPDSGADSVRISKLCDYPVRGWVVEGPSLAAMAQIVGEAALAMQQHNIPHNVLIADCGARVFIFPQCYAEKQARGEVPEHLLDIGVNPAVWEISGHLVLKRRQDYDNFTEASAWELLAAVSLTEEQLDDVARLVFGGQGATARPAGTAYATPAGGQQPVAMVAEAVACTV